MGSAETDRRVANAIRIGTVTKVLASEARAEVDFGDVPSPPLPVAQLRAGGLAFWWMPTEGEQVIVGVPSGDLAQAVIIASIYAGNAPSSDASTPMIALGGGTIIVDGDLQVTGKIHAAGEIQSDTEVIAQSIALTTHKHLKVTPGAGQSGGPTP